MKLNELKSNKAPKFNFGPLYRLERKLNYKALIAFTAIAVAFTVLVIAIYPLMNDMLQDLIAMLGQEQGEALAAMMGASDFNSYFIMNGAQSWGLIAVVYGSYLGYTLVASNFKEHSATMLYSLNVTRNKVLNSKIARLKINVILFNLLTAIISLSVILIYGFEGVSIVNFLIYTLFMTIVTLISGLIMFALSAMDIKGVNTITSIVFPITLVLFATFAMIDESIRFLQYFSPISLVLTDASETVLSSGFAGINYYVLLAWAGLAVVLLPFAYYKFNKKDLI